MATFSIADVGVYDDELKFNQQESSVIEYIDQLISGTASNEIYEYCGVVYGGQKKRRLCCQEFEDLDKNIKVIYKRKYLYKPSHRKSFLSGGIEIKVNQL
jgi:hypothetical protein